MEPTKLPLTTWFLSIYLISQAKTGLSALALKRQLGVSYPTAWLLHQRVNRAMPSRTAPIAWVAPCSWTMLISAVNARVARPGEAPRTRCLLWLPSRWTATAIRLRQAQLGQRLHVPGHRQIGQGQLGGRYLRDQ